MLVVEDDATVRDVVVRYLEHDGYDVDVAVDGPSAIASATARWPDLVVLDLMLPGFDGLEVWRRLRARAPVPVVMLTARSDEEDRIAGLEIGADDYIAKPFSPRELVARVRAVLRRASPPPVPGGASAGSVITTDELVIDVDARQVHRRGEPVVLTAKEFDVLVHLATRPRRAVRREELFEQVWGYTIGDTATVTVHVRRLREKLEADPSTPRHLMTVFGVGYRWDP